MKRVFTIMTAALLLSAGSAFAEKQTKCPIKNKAVNGSKVVEKDGKKIAVCCNGCAGKVKKNFDKYAKKLEKKGIDLKSK
ncbi:MAG: hypothetical protein NE334_18525 [Lentisphaeraceae bacterium]|nr:hypothetical protein [Lentisphaeraceae bacterium]